jgi:uncharacterized protein YyaL (SSP411 family)
VRDPGTPPAPYRLVRATLAPLAVLALLRLAPAAAAGEPEPGGPVARTPNRLARERSPYLRQHMHNPVDWRPWGLEAFEEAKRTGKPVFLSIGYAACHWCHVMEHESFEDEATAALLNDVFVCVKVDREERPDVDDVYMAAVQMTTGHGGWPMTCFLTPDGRPFLARTYLRREDLRAVTARVRDLWRADRPRLEAAAEEVAEAVRAHAEGPDVEPLRGGDAELVAGAVARLEASFDRARGGFDRVPKFPPHAALAFLLDRAPLPGGEPAAAMARTTLDAMAAGGVRDHVGGGFHRYSTDAEWLLPHFEKMLYDNALLASLYARGHAVLGDERWAQVARDAFAWLDREMAVPGGYASSLDADTEGEEGLTYTWTLEELSAALGREDGAFAARVYGASAEGNFRDEATGRRTGRNVLHLPVPLDEVARRDGVALDRLRARLASVRDRLLAARAGRAQPGRDDKVLTAWNALLVSAFAQAGAHLRDPALVEKGVSLARSLLDRSRDDRGRLLRFPRDSGPPILGFLDDHALLADALLDLGEATGDPRWAKEAEALADALLDRFQDPAGGFFNSSTEHEALLARSKEAFDSPIPSGNAVAVRVLLRLDARRPDARRREAADRAIALFRGIAARAPTGATAMIRAISDRERGSARAAVGDASERRGPAQVDVFLERGEAKPGSSVAVVVRVALDPGWHVNAATVSRPDLVATSVATDPRSPARLSALAWPAPTTEGEGRDAIAVHRGTFDVRGRLEVPAGAPPGPRKVALVVVLQPCDETSCRPPEEIRLEVPLRFGEEGAPRHPALFPR